MTDLFPGEARPLPVRAGEPGPNGGWVVRFGPDVPPPPPPVTHASGYEPFVALVEASGADPAVLAADVDAFSAFVREHAARLDDPALARAAGVFLGNALVVLHPGATWQATDEPEVGTVAMSITVVRAVPALIEAPEQVDLARLLATWGAEDARYAAAERATDAAQAAAESAHRSEAPPFVRPSVASAPVLADDRLPYGDRWAGRDGTPPDDAYSRVSHPERYAPLHVVADALIAHLERVYDVTVERTRDEEGETAIIRPAAGAPIRITRTPFPCVQVRAGLLLSRPFPSCGCDACDEDPTAQLEELEQTVLAVVTGGLAEIVTGPDSGSMWLSLPDGGGSGGAGRPQAADRLVVPEAVVALDGRPWSAWPLRG